MYDYGLHLRSEQTSDKVFDPSILRFVVVQVMHRPNEPHAHDTQPQQSLIECYVTTQSDWRPPKLGKSVDMNQIYLLNSVTAVFAQTLERLWTQDFNSKRSESLLQFRVVGILRPDRHKCDSHTIESVQRR